MNVYVPVRSALTFEGLRSAGRVDRLLGNVGSLEVRLAGSRSEVIEAQRLRYRIFREERGLAVHRTTPGRDQDSYDPFCDHLIVADLARDSRIVGTYRLLRHEMALIAGGFYSEAYFDVKRLASQNPGKRILELGRSCVEPDYRNKRTVELLWQGIWAYCQGHDIDILTGCASLHGSDPYEHAAALTFLARDCGAQDQWKTAAIPGRWHSMMLCEPDRINAKEAFLALPPLLKGYLRVGARIGDGCVIDPVLKTTVVLVVLPVGAIAARYRRHFSSERIPGNV